MTGLIWNAYSGIEPSSALVPWLVYPGSFMLRLQQQGIQHARVQVLNQAWGFPDRDERQMLNIDERHYSLIREVLILSDEDVWMFARTVFPMQTLTGKEKRFIHLKSRSLGSVLFNDPNVTRGEFDFACLQPGIPWYEKIEKNAKSQAKEIWARRSIFYIKNKPLLLEEFFMPGLEKL